jgi:hypothetical protein
MGEVFYYLGSFEGNHIEELEGADIHVLGCRRGIPIPEQMQKKITHLLLPHLLGGPHIVSSEMAGAAKIGPLGVRAVGLEKQILFHLIV